MKTRNWFKYLTRCLFKGHKRKPLSQINKDLYLYSCPHCNHSFIDASDGTLLTIVTQNQPTPRQQIGDRIIEFYIPSLYFDNLKKANERYNEFMKKANEQRTEEEQKVYDKELKSLYYKKWGSGYFRDGKDGISIFTMMGLSFDTSVKPLIDNEGYIKVDYIHILLEKISQTQIIKEIEVQKPVGDIVDDKTGKKKAIVKYEIMSDFEKEGRRRKFLKLLETAIDKNERMYVKYTF